MFYRDSYNHVPDGKSFKCIDVASPLYVHDIALQYSNFRSEAEINVLVLIYAVPSLCWNLAIVFLCIKCK